MFLSLPLLFGLLVVAIDCELMPALPGSSTWPRLLPSLALLAVPALLAQASLAAARRRLLTGRAAGVPARALLRLSMLATPLAVHGLCVLGDYTDMVERMAPGSHLGRMLLWSLPPFLAEVPRMGRATLASTTCDLADAHRGRGGVDAADLPRASDVAAFVRMRWGGPLLVALPLLLLGAALDLLQVDRRLYVFVLGTTPGLTFGVLGILLLFVVVLPFWFRIAFGVQPLPEPPATRLRDVARSLGFAPQRLYLLPTGMCSLNAMMVGPLPPGRSLCLTDGLVRELDADTLAGVVAHEVGHARRGHPAVLMTLVVVVPLLALPALRLLETSDVDVALRSALFVLGIVFAWFVVRRLAHRFEHEADIASVQALGSGPCTRALLEVSRLASPVPHGWLGRILSLHPDEPKRWQTMRAYENEPAFRARFEGDSRRLRRVGAATLALAAGAFVWACALEWPFEHVVWRLYTGDHAEAARLRAQITEIPARWERPWQLLERELAVAVEIAPAASDWPAARDALAADAWARGERAWLADGPAAARPYFAMALSATSEPTLVQRVLHAYADAAHEHDDARRDALAAIVRRLGVPATLAAAFPG